MAHKVLAKGAAEILVGWHDGVANAEVPHEGFETVLRRGGCLKDLVKGGIHMYLGWQVAKHVTRPKGVKMGQQGAGCNPFLPTIRAIDVLAIKMCFLCET